MELSRRQLVAYGGLGMAAMGMSALTGCSSSLASDDEDPVAIMGAPLSEDERSESVDDPIYMGSKTNFAGQTLVMGEGRNGQIANQAMIDQREQYNPQLIKITDNVYQATGNGISNSTMVIGKDGIIIIDTGEVNEEMELNMEMFRSVTDKPVAAVMYTHNHYIGGTEYLVGKGNPGNIPVIASSHFVSNDNKQLNDCYLVRAMIQFGMLLPQEGPDAIVSSGLGAFFSNPHLKSKTKGPISPNTFVPYDQEMTRMEVAGVVVECYPMESDSSTNVNYFFPDEGVAVTNSVWPVFFNMYTLRGAPYRDPRILMINIEEIISWNASAHCSAHGLPILGGKDVVRKELTLYHDCIQLVYDQTVRMMNMGMGPDEIAENIVFPAYMLEGSHTKPLYGDVTHYVRAVYSGNVGWFGVDPMELHPVSKSFEAKKIIELMGGTGNVIDAANAALEDDQYAWAAQLATYVLVGSDPDDRAAKAVKAQAFRKMGQVTYATNTRNYYLTNALVLEGKLMLPHDVPVDPGNLVYTPHDLWLDLLRCSLAPERAIDMDTFLKTTFTDLGESITMFIRNCVGVIDPRETGTGKTGVELQMTWETMGKLLTKTVPFDDLVSQGAIRIVGSTDDLARIRGIFDRSF